MEKKNIFSAIINATGKNFEIEKSVSGSYRLLLDGEPIIDDSACEDVNGDYETAVDYYSNYLLEYEVPKDKKIMRLRHNINAVAALYNKRGTTYKNN